MNLIDVWRWARCNASTSQHFAALYRDALMIAISRLLRSIHRESIGRTVLCRENENRWTVSVGVAPKIRAAITPPGSLGFWELTELPVLMDGNSSSTLEYSRPFLRALRGVLPVNETAYERLVGDFQNSLANLVLNRVVARSGNLNGAIEPCFDGHYIHPFPGLRIGPTVKMVADCSNLSTRPVSLRILELSDALFYSSVFKTPGDCAREALGFEGGDRFVTRFPVHPWQLELSPTIRALLQLGHCQLTDHRVQVLPLASQRTCRVLDTGFDIKLPIDSTITGEHRLLYAANVRNAPVVSALARSALEELWSGVPHDQRTLHFQYDVASMTHADPVIGRHVAAIVRAPMPVTRGARLIPALQIWANLQTATSAFGITSAESAYSVFERYCMLLLDGPISMYWRFGLALEPHVQNSLISIRDGLPVSIVLRDLDGTILDRDLVTERLRAVGLQLPVSSWLQFPSFAAGAQRLGHSIIHAHLAIAEARLSQVPGVDRSTLSEIIDDAWTAIVRATPARHRLSVSRVRTSLQEVKCLLKMRLECTPNMVFAAGQHP